MPGDALDLNAILVAFGRSGQAVVRVTLTLADGSEIAATLPPRAAAEAEPVAQLDPGQRLVMAALAKSPDPMGFAAIFTAVGWALTGGKPQGRGAQVVREMARGGLIVRKGGLFSDDPAKFGDDENPEE